MKMFAMCVPVVEDIGIAQVSFEFRLVMKSIYWLPCFVLRKAPTHYPLQKIKWFRPRKELQFTPMVNFFCASWVCAYSMVNVGDNEKSEETANCCVV